MGQRLALNVKRNNKVLFVIYQHWGGYTDNEVAVVCKLLSVYNKNDSLATLLRKTTEVLPQSGLIIPTDPLELETVKTYLEEGIPFGTNRSAGLIAITPKEMEDAWRWQDDEADLNLDGKNRILDLYYITNTPDYPEDVVPAKRFLLKPITKENALDLLDLYEKNYSDWYSHAGAYYYAITG